VESPRDLASLESNRTHLFHGWCSSLSTPLLSSKCPASSASSPLSQLCSTVLLARGTRRRNKPLRRGSTHPLRTSHTALLAPPPLLYLNSRSSRCARPHFPHAFRFAVSGGQTEPAVRRDESGGSFTRLRAITLTPEDA
jgi:hypothetical protein